MQERHLDFVAIFESASKFAELFLRTFDLLDKNCSALFFTSFVLYF